MDLKKVNEEIKAEIERLEGVVAKTKDEIARLKKVQKAIG